MKQSKQFGFTTSDSESYGFGSEAEAVRAALDEGLHDAEMTYEGQPEGRTVAEAAEDLGIGHDVTGIYYESHRMVEILSEAFDNVELWHTGGGCMNPVIVFHRSDETDRSWADRYIMFSDGWHQAEASFGYYDETDADDWASGINIQAPVDKVPMDPAEIIQMVRDFIAAENIS